MTSKDVFSFHLSDGRGGFILIEAQSRYSQAGPMTGLVKGTTAGRAKKIFPAHSSRLLKPMLLPPLTVGVTASVSSSSSLCWGGGCWEHTFSLSAFLWNHSYFVTKSKPQHIFSSEKWSWVFKRKVAQSQPHSIFFFFLKNDYVWLSWSDKQQKLLEVAVATKFLPNVTRDDDDDDDDGRGSAVGYMSIITSRSETETRQPPRLWFNKGWHQSIKSLLMYK